MGAWSSPKGSSRGPNWFGTGNARRIELSCLRTDFPTAAKPLPAYQRSPPPSPARNGMAPASSGCVRLHVRRPVMATDAKVLRCAIYTRKSTEHGLDQEFNSLDAQREACEAYIKSQ